ncbi:6435_t:CDS:1 [Paraglomus brasilianum]|uniref:6435_t:CDS:1 n=1 Tax=Paraglomus brasilianum TaxID=144538 RepID=A0A9N8WLA2_9GLOM|nr:6435_t:CDS:1 [Paraglomus brasilianum]
MEPVNPGSSLIVTAAQAFEKCSDLAEGQKIMESMAKEVEVNKDLFYKAVVNFISGNKSILEESFKPVTDVELVEPVSTDIAQYKNAIETLLIFVRKYENVANGLETAFEEISDNLKSCSNNIKDYLEDFNDIKEELKRLQQNKYKPDKRQSTGKWSTAANILSLAASFTVGGFAPELLLGGASLSAAYNSNTCSGACEHIEQLREKIKKLEIQINSKKTVEVLYEALRGATVEAGQTKAYWKKRNYGLEGLLKKLENHEQRGQHLDEAEARNFRTEWLDYQKEYSKYSSTIVL